MENSKTVAQTLLGETAHFGFYPPKLGFFRGVGGSPNFFFFIGIFIFLWVRSSCKNLKSYDTSLCSFSNGGNSKWKNTKNSGQPSAQHHSDQNLSLKKSKACPQNSPPWQEPNHPHNSCWQETFSQWRSKSAKTLGQRKICCYLIGSCRRWHDDPELIVICVLFWTFWPVNDLLKKTSWAEQSHTRDFLLDFPEFPL